MVTGRWLAGLANGPDRCAGLAPPLDGSMLGLPLRPSTLALSRLAVGVPPWRCPGSLLVFHLGIVQALGWWVLGPQSLVLFPRKGIKVSQSSPKG